MNTTANIRIPYIARGEALSSFQEHLRGLNKISSSDNEAVANITTQLGQSLDHYLDKDTHDVLPGDYQQFYDALNEVFLNEASFVRNLLDGSINDARERGGYLVVVEYEPPKQIEASEHSAVLTREDMSAIKKEARELCKLVNGECTDKIDEILKEARVYGALALRDIMRKQLDSGEVITGTLPSVAALEKLTSTLAKQQGLNRLLAEAEQEAEGTMYETEDRRLEVLGNDGGE